jgi:hypothetical protein
MAAPQAGDLVIRVQTNTLPTTYIVTDAQSRQVLGGPFASMAEAAIAASKLVGPMAAVWQEHIDQRGRPLGPPQRLPVSRT